VQRQSAVGLLVNPFEGMSTRRNQAVWPLGARCWKKIHRSRLSNTTCRKVVLEPLPVPWSFPERAPPLVSRRFILGPGRVAELTDPLAKSRLHNGRDQRSDFHHGPHAIVPFCSWKMETKFFQTRFDVLSSGYGPSLPVTASKLEANVDEAHSPLLPSEFRGIGISAGWPRSRTRRLRTSRLAGGNPVYCSLRSMNVKSCSGGAHLSNPDGLAPQHPVLR